MFRQIGVTTLAVLILSVAPHAHGGAKHILGTVTALNGNQLTLKAKDGKTVSILLNEQTKYYREKVKLAREDLKVGLRVMVEAREDKKKNVLIASEVHLGSASSGQQEKDARASGTPAKHKHD